MTASEFLTTDQAAQVAASWMLIVPMIFVLLVGLGTWFLHWLWLRSSRRKSKVSTERWKSVFLDMGGCMDTMEAAVRGGKAMLIYSDAGGWELWSGPPSRPDSTLLFSEHDLNPSKRLRVYFVTVGPEAQLLELKDAQC